MVSESKHSFYPLHRIFVTNAHVQMRINSLNGISDKHKKFHFW